MEFHDSYTGLQPFGVLIDRSSELEELVSRARDLKDLPFEQKLAAVKSIALTAMVNAYEQSKTHPDPERRAFHHDMVMSPHSLGEALREEAGCCRYQGALFFVLGYEANLGDIHFIQQAPVDPDEFKYGTKPGLVKGGFRSVFNDIVHDGKLTHTSIFKESLTDPSLDYSISNPQVFESAIGFGWPKGNTSPVVDNWAMRHFSYHRADSGLVIASEKGKHVKKLPDDYAKQESDE